MSDQQNQQQSASNDQQNQGGSSSLYPLIPQDKDHGVRAIAAGLTLTDLFLVLLPPAGLFLLATDVFGVPVGLPLFGACALTGLALFAVASYAPFYLTPYELVRRNVAYLRRRIRMPLIGEEARNVPGIAAVHRRYATDALEHENQTVFALVEAPLPNTSQRDDGEMMQWAAQIAREFDTKISKYEDEGFGLTAHLSQYAYEADELDVFRQAQTDGSLTEYERQLAEAREEFMIDGEDEEEAGYLAEQGVMDRSLHFVVPVEADEGVGIHPLEEKLRSLDILRLTPAQRVSQVRLLDQRVEKVEEFARAIVGGAHRLDADEMIGLQRAHWQNERGLLDPGAVTTGRPVLAPDDARITVEDETTDSADGAEGKTAESTTEIESDTEAITETGRSESAPSAPAPQPLADTTPGADMTRAIESESSEETEIDPEPSTLRERVTRLGARLKASVTAHTNATTRNRMYNLYAPQEVDEHKDHVDLGDGEEYAASIYVTGWPKLPTPGVLESAVTMPGVRYDLSLQFDPTERYDKRDELQKEKENIGGSALVSEYFGDVDSSDADAAAVDKTDLREYMREHRVDVSEVSVVLTARGRTEEHVQRAIRALKNECKQNGISVKEATKDQLAALRTTAPAARDVFSEVKAVDLDYDLPADAVGCLLANGGGVRQDPGGTVLGMAKTGAGDSPVLGPLQIDRDRLAAPHRTIGGESGTGKTAGENMDIIEDHLRNPGVRTVIIDVGEGFDGPVYAQGGAKIEVGETKINPFEINPPEDGRGSGRLIEGRAELITSMLMAYLRQRAPDEADDLRDPLRNGVMRTFRRFGIVPEDPATVNPSHPDRETDREPEFGDFYHDTLKRMAESPEEFVGEHIAERREEKAKDLLEYLAPFDASNPDAKYGFLDGQSDVDMTAETVLLDAKEYAQSGGPELSMTIRLATGFARNIARSSDDPVRVVVDEAHEVFHDEEDAQKFASLVLEGRSHGLGFDFISQATKHFIDGPAGVIADQCRINIWHEVGDLSAALADVFGLSAEQERLIAGGLDRGDNDGTDRSESLVFVNNDAYLVERKLSNHEKPLVDYKERKHGDWDAYMARETAVHDLPEADVEVIEGISPEQASQLYAADIHTTVDLTTAGAEMVAEAVNVAPRRALDWIQQAYRGEYVERGEHEETAAREHAPDAASAVTPAEQEAATDGGMNAAQSDAQRSGTAHGVTGPDAEHGATAPDSGRADGPETPTPDANASADLELTDVDRVGERRADRLRAAGYGSVVEIEDAGSDALTEVEGIGATRADRIATSASRLLASDQQDTQAVADGGTARDTDADANGGET